jgi:hypothetical protein
MKKARVNRFSLNSAYVRGRIAETVSRLMDLMGAMVKILKYAAIIAVVAGIIANVDDIRRYIKISTM